MSDDHKGNPVKAVFNPETGVTSNFVATRPDIPVPDKKHDYSHGHYDVNTEVRTPSSARPALDSSDEICMRVGPIGLIRMRYRGRMRVCYTAIDANYVG